jgi:hypothetical protein
LIGRDIDVSGSGAIGLLSLVIEVDDAIENELAIKSLSVTIGAKISCVNVKSFLFSLKFFFFD